MLKALIAGLVLACAPLSAFAQIVGVQSVTVNDPLGSSFPLTIWYPADQGGTETAKGQTGVFRGATGFQDAPVRPGRFPTILLSHGGMRSAPDSGAWIAKGLAEKGFLVLEIGAPKGLSPAEIRDQIWQAPRRTLLVLELLGPGNDWQDRIEWHNLGALGFFLGGTQAIQLGGGQLDPTLIGAACDQGKSVDCGWFKAQGLALGQIDAKRLGASYKAPQIGSVVAVAPEYGFAFTADSLAAMQVPAAAIALGGNPAFDTAPLTGHGLESMEMPKATPADAFALCSEKGPAILAEEGEDPALCGDPEQRQKLHDALIGQIATFFRTHMPRD